jgi:cell division protein FtsL
MLEQSAWSTQSRIEKVATQKLAMQTPNQQSIVMVKP